jgi:hypothetical protein
MGLLSFSLASDWVVGSNLRGEASGAGWLYCLPRLTFGHVVCLGAPGHATLSGLARAGEEVLVLTGSATARRRTRRMVSDRGWSNVEVRNWRRDDGDPRSGAIDLVVVTASGVPARTRAAALNARLAPDGMAYHEPPFTARQAGDSARLNLALTPSHGEVRAVVPAGDTAMRDAVARLGLEGTVMRRPKLARWERAATAHLAMLRSPRFATVVAGPAVDLSGVPRYLRDVAATDGYPLEGWSYGVSARGDYDSQKILVLLAAAPDDMPTGIVKITRSDIHAARLQNEASTLRQLAELRVAKERTPQPWFSGFYAGRAVLGASLMTGRPYRVLGAGDGPEARAQLSEALAWLTELAEVTAHPVPAADVAAVLLTLLGRFQQLYAPPAWEVAALRAQFEQLGAQAAAVPSVLQHGDPGIWNLFVDDQGRTVFLDWEAGEPDGMPLWDLLYLFRSHAIEAGRRAGVRDRVDAAARHLTGEGPLADLLVDAVREYCARVGLAPQAVSPLTYGCWLHRSLKEAARSPAGRLDQGLSVRLIRRMLAQPDAPTTRRLSRADDGQDG